MSIVDISHLTDEVVGKAFEGTNFGRTDFRTILAETVMKRAAGYHAGWTATTICTELGLLAGDKQEATKIGLSFAFHHYYRQPVRDALNKQGALGEAQHDREADRVRFPDLAFNRWLDEAITENAEFTVWDQIGDVAAAWSGWGNRAFYGAPPSERDADRYRKLRRWMSSNVPEGWSRVKELAAVACYMGWDDFDRHLDDLPECQVGLCQTQAPTQQAASTRCSVCGAPQFESPSGTTCKNGHGGADSV